jgi:vacuolar-type H+-ATPase subunit E/Vma4
MVQEIYRQASARLGVAVQKKNYQAVLLGWIVEAMIGLDVESAQVNASQAEMELIQRELLDQAETRVREIAGRTVRLQKSDKPPLLSQGVVLEAEGGRLVFNNQVSTRLLRYRSEILKLIASALPQEGSP